MLKIRPRALALAGMFAAVCHASTAATIHEDFSTDPAAQGWSVFGDTRLFRWSAINQNLEVTWDSSKPNSYFYIPIGTVLTRNDDFAFEFDLQLSDIGTGNMPGPFELGIGFLNLAAATNASFQRAVYSPNLAEFDYYPAGYYTNYGEVPATTTPGFISRTGLAYAPTMLTPYESRVAHQPNHSRPDDLHSQQSNRDHLLDNKWHDLCHFAQSRVEQSQPKRICRHR